MIEVAEGRVRLFTYDLSRYRRLNGVYEPAWLPVFYNPAAVLSRDFSILVASTLDLRESIVLDALSGTGVRALRYCSEVSNISKCFANDIDTRAYELIVKNIALNNLQDRVEALNDDANVVMYKLKKSGVRVDLIDIDPYGSPAPFIRAASWGVRSGGYIGITSTDLASLSGVRPLTGSRRYWCSLTLTDVPRLIALHVLVGYAARVAAELDRYIEPLTYIIGGFFVRVFYRIRRGARKADSMLSKSMGYLKYCGVCGFREFSRQIEEIRCSMCGSRISYVGPLWIDGLVNQEYIEKARRSLAVYTYISSHNQLSKLFECQTTEIVDRPLAPYDIVQLSSRLKVSSPKIEKVVNCLKSLGCKTVRYCGVTTAIGTDCSYIDVISCVKQLTST
ncbi:MAG: RsmD family RNA methyltransferase [Sulfolobales archaeon]|nr:RsmD family RNA methyltransferase [Sulfolobales archaeon]